MFGGAFHGISLGSSTLSFIPLVSQMLTGYINHNKPFLFFLFFLFASYFSWRLRKERFMKIVLENRQCLGSVLINNILPKITIYELLVNFYKRPHSLILCRGSLMHKHLAVPVSQWDCSTLNIHIFVSILSVRLVLKLANQK